MKPHLAALLVALACTPPLVATPAASPGGRTGPREVLPFVHDDYANALAQARARKLPLFIDAWAPW